jgi:hypothetical protein
MRHAVLALGVSLLVILPACREAPGEPSRRPVAHVGEQSIYAEEVESYFALNLIEDDTTHDLPPTAMDEVKSRLFDALLEERLLLAEAERREIRVTDLEVEAYLDMGGADVLDDPDALHERQSEARQRLMVQKLQEQVIREQDPPTDDEVENYAAEHAERLLPAQPLELRALQLESMNQAKRVRNEIRRKRITFNEAALVHDPSPGEALPLQMSWDSLSTELREALKDLKPGQISEPMELHGSIYLFKVGAWLKNEEDQDVELLRRARSELESLGRRDALDALVASLRERSGVRIEAGNLPFAYVPAEDAATAQN